VDGPPVGVIERGAGVAALDEYGESRVVLRHVLEVGRVPDHLLTDSGAEGAALGG